MSLTVGHAQSLGLVKACIMREGTLGSGDVMSKENVMHGAGALRAMAFAGMALVDIDHHMDGLPAPYAEKYGPGIADPYPVGHIIDCQAVTAKDGLAEVQCIMMIHNRTAYDLIESGQVRGCSVVDMPRKKVCNAKGACRFEGSTYVMNTLALEGTPNSPGTWVRTITAEDIGTIITHTVKHTTTAETPVQRLINERLSCLLTN